MLSHNECGRQSIFQSEFENVFQQLLLCINRNFENCIKNAVKTALNEQHQELSPSQKEVDDSFITRSEAIQFLKISYPTLHRYQKSGLLPYHKVGRKVYFNKVDLITATKVQLKRKGIAR